MKQEILTLREKMEREGIDVYYVPSGDFHASEYVNDYFKEREFMSNLTGESGELVVTKDGAYLWTDGRYFLQAKQQLAGTEIELMRMAEPGVPTVEEFLADLAKNGGYVLGFDGRVLPAASGESLAAVLNPLGVTFRWDVDLVDEVWTTRPALVPSEIYELPLETVGVSAEDKMESVRKEMAERGADYLLVSDLMECAWLLNLRGADIDYTPVFFSYIVLGKDSVDLFVMDGALKNGLPEHLSFVNVHDYYEINDFVSKLPAGSTLWMDKGTANLALSSSVAESVTVIDDMTPIALMKAVKNAVELASTKNAHLKDAVAVIEFTKWVKEAVKEGKITELDCAEKLLACRKAQDGFFDLSFETIAGYGSNGAIIHYAPTPETDLELQPKGFLLLDSGGHYNDGTTDITRTIAVGPLTQEEIDDYTYVLKSHLAMWMAVLKPEDPGKLVDAIARKPLRDVGLDFKHGIGHGVGHLLSVHEGPNILRRVAVDIPLDPGMIITDEPGVYIDGKFGVRIENELLTVGHGDGTRTFDTLTYVPYEREAINVDLLTEDEISWINAYYVDIRQKVAPLIDDAELKSWLMEQTEPLA